MALDHEGRLQLWNRAAENIYGWDEGEVLGRAVPTVPDDRREEYGALRMSVLDGGRLTAVETRRRRKNGTEVDVLMWAAPLVDEEGRATGCMALVADNSERKQLLEAHRRLASILENTTDLIGTFSTDGRILYLNRGGRRLLGLEDREDLSAMTLADLYPRCWRHHLEKQVLPAAVRDHAWSGEASIVSREGKEIPVFQVFIAHGSPGGRTEAFSIITRDITKLKSLEEQVRQSQKMEVVGTLTNGIAHDFNNLLTVINGYTELLGMKLPQQDPRLEEVRQIRKAGERAQALVRQLLAFSRRQPPRPVLVSLNDVLRDIEPMLRRVMPEDVELAVYRGPGLWPVRADPGQLEQVVLNLAVNARDAIPDGGKLVFTTGNVELSPAEASAYPGAAAGRYTALWAEDSGIGMDEATLGRIFEPFFTTKEQGKGTGLGLSTVYGIIKQSGGRVYVSSEPGRGTRFEILLPAAEGGPETTIRTPTAPVAPGGSETIVVVEDDEGVRSFAKRALEAKGYRVHVAANGFEALRIFERQPATAMDLVVTDVVMPELGGRELAKRLAKSNPAVKILYLSGHVDRSDLPEGSALLTKPFTAEVLAAEVRKLLDTK